MRTKIFGGILVDLFGTAAVVAVGFAVVPLYLKFLSPAEYGLWLSISAMVALIGVFDIATDQYLTTAAADSEMFESKGMSERLFLVLLVKCVTVLGLLIIGLIVFSQLGSLIEFAPHLQTSGQAAFGLALVSLCVVTVCNSIPTILLARRHFVVVNAASAVTAIIASLGALCFLELGLGLSSLPVSIVIAGLLQYKYLFSMLKRHYPNLTITARPVKIDLLMDLLKYSLSFHFVRCVYGIFRTQYILVAVGAFLGPSAVASLSVTNRLPSTMSANSMKLAIPFFPSLAELFAKGEVSAAREIFFGINKVLVRIALFAVIVLYFANREFVSLWVGEHLFGGESVTAWLLLYVLLYIPMGAFGIIVYSSKRFGKWPLWLLVEMLATVVLSFYFARGFGLAGVVAAFVAGAAISQIYLFRLVQKELGFTLREYVTRLGLYVVGPNIVTLLGGLVYASYVGVHGWISLIAMIVVLALLQTVPREGVRLMQAEHTVFRKKLIWAFSL